MSSPVVKNASYRSFFAEPEVRDAGRRPGGAADQARRRPALSASRKSMTSAFERGRDFEDVESRLAPFGDPSFHVSHRNAQPPESASSCSRSVPPSTTTSVQPAPELGRTTIRGWADAGLAPPIAGSTLPQRAFRENAGSAASQQPSGFPSGRQPSCMKKLMLLSLLLASIGLPARAARPKLREQVSRRRSRHDGFQRHLPVHSALRL